MSSKECIKKKELQVSTEECSSIYLEIFVQTLFSSQYTQTERNAIIILEKLQTFLWRHSSQCELEFLQCSSRILFGCSKLEQCFILMNNQIIFRDISLPKKQWKKSGRKKVSNLSFEAIQYQSSSVCTGWYQWVLMKLLCNSSTTLRKTSMRSRG